MDQLTPITVDGIPIFDCVYIHEQDRYYVREANSWNGYSDRNFRLRLRAEGLSQRVSKGADLSPLESALTQVQIQRKVNFALPLAGYPVGVLDAREQDSCEIKKILVTNHTQPLEGRDTPWPHLHQYLTELLGLGPLPYHIGWWQWARKNLRADEKTVLPGQVPVYIGPAGAGKSFLQRLTTRLLGGRSANPFTYMSGASNFNAELFMAEHLVIEDSFFEFTLAQRRKFGSKIKELTVNHTHSCHAKGRTPIKVTPKWRVSISLNDERENLSVLPPLDNSMLDKLMLFKCRMPTFPVDLGTMEGWKKWDQIVSDELPGLAHFIDNFKLGPLATDRYGVKPWHDPEIIKMEEEISPEALLLQCIRHDLPLTLEGTTTWEGSSLTLRNTLTGTAMPSHDQSRKVLSWPGACGTYLGRLSKRFKAAITKRIVRGNAIWIIDLNEL